MLLSLLCVGCAHTPPPLPLANDSSVSLSVSSQVPVPAGFIFERKESQVKPEKDVASAAVAVLGSFLRSKPSSWDRNADIREHVKPGDLIPPILIDAFMSDITNTLHCRIVVDAPDVADAGIYFQITEMDWMDTLANPFTGHSKPLIRITALLVGNPPCTEWEEDSKESPAVMVPCDQGVHPVLYRVSTPYWGTHRSWWAPVWHMNTYIKRPEILRKSLRVISADAGRDMARRFQKRFEQESPPKSRE